MKTIITSMLIALATSAYATSDSVSVTWTSDTTYVRGGVEYWAPEASEIKEWKSVMSNDPELEEDYCRFWIYEAPMLKRPILDDQLESSIV